jgi:hypothetical protein
MKPFEIMPGPEIRPLGDLRDLLRRTTDQAENGTPMAPDVETVFKPVKPRKPKNTRPK